MFQEETRQTVRGSTTRRGIKLNWGLGRTTGRSLRPKRAITVPGLPGPVRRHNRPPQSTVQDTTTILPFNHTPNPVTSPEVTPNLLFFIYTCSALERRWVEVQDQNHLIRITLQYPVIKQWVQSFLSDSFLLPLKRRGVFTTVFVFKSTKEPNQEPPLNL